MSVDLVAPYLILGMILFFAELLYITGARKVGIVDTPNKRSSHTRVVVRGGGVIFFLSVLCWFCFTGSWPWFLAGLSLVAVGSFIDDRSGLPAGLRFAIHLLSVCLLFYDAGVLAWPTWLVALAMIVCIGTINAFNFMDGINGITGLYGLVTLFSFIYIDINIVDFTDASLAVATIVSLVVFLFFNFRKKAFCFAGDVGSVTLAFVLIFLMLQLVVATDNYLWPLLFLVYGTDSIVTIVYRLRKKENIFKAHRQHLYQYLSNELKRSHLVVATMYGFIQLLVNVVVIYSIQDRQYILAIIASGLFVLSYIFVREGVIKKIDRPVSVQ